MVLIWNHINVILLSKKDNVRIISMVPLNKQRIA